MLSWFSWVANSAVDWLPLAVRLLTVLSIVAGSFGLVFMSVAAIHAVREGRERHI